MAKRGNIDNLIKNEDLTPEERRRNASKAGKASGVARRKKKTMLETLETALALTLNDDEVTNIDDIKNLKDVKGKNITLQDAIILAQIQKAMKGDVKSANWIMELIDKKDSKKEEDKVVIVDDF